MNPIVSVAPAPPAAAVIESSRLAYLDAVRAFALLLGIVFHAGLSFMPIFIGWAVMDTSTSTLVAIFVLTSHAFRMELFFLVAGFFAHMSYHRSGPAAFLRSRFLRIVVPFLVGWVILRPLIVSGWIMGGASLRGDVDIPGALVMGFQSLVTLRSETLTGTHLWFLYYLAMITAIVVVLRATVASTGRWHETLHRGMDPVIARLCGSRWLLPALVAPTAAVVWFMRDWGVDTPDRSLVPHIPVLLLYGGCFVTGWLLHRHVGAIAAFSRLTAVRWIIAVVSAAVVVSLVGLQADTGHPRYLLARAGYIVAYATMMWSFVLLTVGVFRRLCARPSAIVRYVADSSYWMYLIHLPIVVWLQVAVAELPFHWSLKMTGISAVTIAVALLTYDLFVRSTIIGRVLNGRRRERAIFHRGPRRSVAGQA